MQRHHFFSLHQTGTPEYRLVSTDTLVGGRRRLLVSDSRGGGYLEEAVTVRPDYLYGLPAPRRTFLPSLPASKLTLDFGELDSALVNGNWLATIFLCDQGGQHRVPVLDQGMWACEDLNVVLSDAGSYLDLLAGWVMEQCVERGESTGSIVVDTEPSESAGSNLRHGILRIDTAFTLELASAGRSGFPWEPTVAQPGGNARVEELSARLELNGCGPVEYGEASSRIVRWRVPCNAELEWDMVLHLETMAGEGSQPIRQTLAGFVMMEGMELE